MMKKKIIAGFIALVFLWLSVCPVLPAYAWGDSYRSSSSYDSSYSRWDDYKSQNNYKDTQSYQFQNLNWFSRSFDSITASVSSFLNNTANFFKSTWNNITSFTSSAWNNVTNFLGFKSSSIQTPASFSTPSITSPPQEQIKVNTGNQISDSQLNINKIDVNSSPTIKSQSLNAQAKSTDTLITKEKFSDYQLPSEIMHVPTDLTLPLPVTSGKEQFIDYVKRANIDVTDKHYGDYQQLFLYEKAKLQLAERTTAPQADKISQDTVKPAIQLEQVQTTQDQTAKFLVNQQVQAITPVILKPADSSVIPAGPKATITEPDIIYTPKTFNDHIAGILNRAEQDYNKSSSRDNSGFVFLGLVAGETFKEIGSLFTSYDYKPHVVNAKNPEAIKVIYSNGIANDNPEGFAPSYAGNFKGTLAKNGADKNQVYLLPLYENGHIATDAASWLADLTTNKLTNEVVAKMDNELATRPPEQKNNPITAVLYSGAYNPFMKALNQRPDYNVGTVVAVGAAWPVKDNTYFNQDSLNPNLKLVVNIYGSNDILYKTGLAGNMKFNNVETVNIEILGAGHNDYFDNPKMSDINIKTKDFITRTVVAVNRGGNDLKDLLEVGFIKYDKKNAIYIVDANKINLR